MLTCVGCALCVPWGPHAPPPALHSSLGEDEGGCPTAAQPWCATSRALTLPQFLMSYAAVSVGYPLAVTLIQTIFSKVLGPRPQVTIQETANTYF